MTDRVAEYDVRAATDEQLLVRFRQCRDEQAFAELVRRYEAMVFGVARQMLGCHHAAEDVFQATFLVLARDARKIRNRRALSSWLYGVTYRISARLAKQRAARVEPLQEEPMVHRDPLEEIRQRVEQQRVHDELHRLPDRVRAPMVLRYLQGKSNWEVAEALNLSESAVEGRLKRGRNHLRIRLARHGIGFVAAVCLLERMKGLASSAPPGLSSATVSACLATDLTQSSIKDHVALLAEQETVPMMTTSLSKAVLVGCLTLGTLTVGWTVVPRWADALAGEGPAATEDVWTRTITAPPPAGTTVPIAESQPAGDAAGDPSSQRLGRYDLKQWSPSEERILAALNAPTRLEFNETPLSEVIDFLEDFHGIQIVVDSQALEDEGVDITSETITMNLSDITFRTGLRLMLRELNLTYTVREEVLMITSEQQAEEKLDPRVYKLPWRPSNIQELVNVIKVAISPDSWDEAGGPGSITHYGGGLVISQSYSVHEEINEFLKQLERLQEAQP